MNDVLFQKLLIIVPVALAIYYLLPRRLQNYWLLFVSYGFYMSWIWTFALVLLALTLANFVVGREIQAAERGRRVLLWVGIGLNALALALMKYPAFFLRKGVLARAGPALAILGIPLHSASDVLLPLGLSFVVLGLISYLVDVYRGQVEASSDLVDFALYVAYFPKLISGPIERARTFLPKLADRRIVDNEALARSFTLIVVGLFRKLAIADPLAAMTPPMLFEEPGEFGAPVLITWLIAYAFSLYNDFAGYTSLVRGISGLFGIELSPNFQQPYFARNFTEFWTRWHITLSHWLRDYIFFPLSRALLRRNPSRRSAVNLVVPPMTTMLLCGLWHNAAWPMLLWGGLHGLYQVIERIPTLWRPVVPPQQRPHWRQATMMLSVFVLATLAWVPFRASTLPQALSLWRGLFDWGGGWIGPDIRVIILVVPALLLDWAQYRRGELVFLHWPRLAQATALAVAALAIFLVLRAELQTPPFVYQGF